MRSLPHKRGPRSGLSMWGRTLSQCLGRMTVDGALRDGIVHDWDAAEALMEHSLKNARCDPTDHPLLMAEPSFNPTANRLKLTEIAFEKFSVPALFLSKNAVLAGTPHPSPNPGPSSIPVPVPKPEPKPNPNQRSPRGGARRWCSMWAAASRARPPCTTATC